jgi:hypothetical protein
MKFILHFTQEPRLRSRAWKMPYRRARDEEEVDEEQQKYEKNDSKKEKWVPCISYISEQMNVGSFRKLKQIGVESVLVIY